MQSYIFAEEVQHFHDFFLSGTLVYADITHIGQKGEVDDSVLVLLVMGHEFIKSVILLAGKGEGTVVGTHELQCLLQD